MKITTMAMPLMLVLFTFSFQGTAEASWADIPEEPEVHFKAFVPQYAQIQKDFSFSLEAYDDRSAYHDNAPSEGYLKGADVTVTITPSWDDHVIGEIHGKTLGNGYFADSEFVIQQDYLSHAQYNMTISVQYIDSVDVQEFQFWTILLH